MKKTVVAAAFYAGLLSLTGAVYLDAQTFSDWTAPVNLGTVINTASGEV